MAKKCNPIFFMEKNQRGAWVVYGDIGIKQYYYYTKTEAARLTKKRHGLSKGNL